MPHGYRRVSTLNGLYALRARPLWRRDAGPLSACCGVRPLAERTPPPNACRSSSYLPSRISCMRARTRVKRSLLVRFSVSFFTYASCSCGVWMLGGMIFQSC